MTHSRIFLGKTDKQSPVAAEQRNRAMWSVRNRREDLLEIRQFYNPCDYAQEFSIAASYLARDRDHPPASDGTTDGLPHKRNQLRISPECWGRILIRGAYIWHRPRARKIDQLSFRVRNYNGIDIRQRFNAVFETFIDVSARHQTFKIFRRYNAQSFNSLDFGRLKQFDRLKTAINLFCKNQGEIMEYVLFFCEGAIAKI